MIGVIAHYLLRESKNDLEQLALGVAGVEERRHLVVAHIAAIAHHCEREFTERLETRCGQRGFVAQGLGDGGVDLIAA